MDTLRSVAHLQREIGNRLFNVLVSSDNTNAVREFAETLDKNALPKKVHVGGIPYEILNPLQESREPVTGDTVVDWAKTAHLNEEDVELLLDNQELIPVSLRGMIVAGLVFGVCWLNDRWVEGWHRLDEVYYRVSYRK